MNKNERIKQILEMVNKPEPKGLDEIWVNNTPFSSRKNGTNRSTKIVVTSIDCAENLLKLMEG